MTIVIKGSDLTKRRRAKGLTQAALGAMLGVSGAAVSQWERGTTTPSWQQAQKLEEIFEGVTPPESTRLDRMEAELSDIKEQLRRLLGE